MGDALQRPDNPDIWVRDWQLTELPGWPSTRQATARKAKRDQVPRRIAMRRGGGYEYNARFLEPRALAALLMRLDAADSDSNPIPQDVGDAELQSRPHLVGSKTDSRDPSHSSSAPAGKATTSPAGATFSPEKEAERTEALTHWADKRPERQKRVGRRRLAALKTIELLQARGFKRGEAVNMAAGEAGQSPATVYRWLARVKDRPREQWYPLLIPLQAGGGRRTKISPRVWDVFIADYLRLSAPAMTACYERTQRIAQDRGWGPLPSLRTFQRKLQREVPASAVTLARKGTEALAREYPAQERDHSVFHAMEAVNADGHRFDVFVRWPDGTVARPILLAWQDVYSGKLLAWDIDRTENKDLVRVSFGRMVEKYGIPDRVYLDNGRAFTAKSISGGVSNRFRFKVLDEDPVGIITAMGCDVHWATPYHGQAKPIERGFRDLCEYIAKHPAFEGAYTGNKPDAKPENYGSHAIPLDDFLAVFVTEWVAHNAREGRRSAVCNGRSFDAVFAESYAKSVVIRATASQRRMWLMAAEQVRANRQDGSFRLFGNRYWTEEMAQHKGEKLIVRFDQDRLHDSVYVYDQANRYLAEADCIQATGFDDAEAAKEFNRIRSKWMKAQKKALELQLRLEAADVVNMLPALEEPELPEAKVVGGFFGEATFQKKKEEEEDPREAEFIRIVQGMSPAFHRDPEGFRNGR